MSFSIGIVGLPNVGKSTLFKALTKKAVDIANYPFCTIEPNVGVVKVPDQRLYELAKISKSAQVIHTAIEFVDIAGLVKGAHKGEGLGNQFLAKIKEVDAIAMVVRGFLDKNIIHVHNKIDPQEDVDVLHLELIFADLQTLGKRIDNLQKQLKGNPDKMLLKKKDLYEKIKNHLENGQLANTLVLDEEETFLIKELNLLTSKPFLYLHNVDENALDKSLALKGIAASQIINICAKTESELAELSEEDAQVFMKELNITQSGLDKVIAAAYDSLNLITFFTTGPQETRAWTIPRGALAPQAAGKIHTDFEQGFIRAEVIGYDDFIKCQSEQAAKEQGLMRLEGKEYLVCDGDIMHFRFAN